MDLSELAAEADGVSKIVLEAVQEMLLKLALQMARDDYETRRDRQRQGIEIAKDDGKYAGRKADPTIHDRIIALRTAKHSISRTAKLAGCSISQVTRIWAKHQTDSKRKGRYGVELLLPDVEAMDEEDWRAFDGRGGVRMPRKNVPKEGRGYRSTTCG